ncbi:LptF/LptG family permease [Candidatus Neptunochlamydia vexilliferae]|uniref:Permease, YjgP/YjgQ family n=1 Tax=Candidatus Neptunichlamydia vexilliferae TaxID=1651774 RepID=A0ABS0AZF6_9BACT|nr:LptF/LptG family permease [Candidatus Neptunochlamydia vexilliferae]MBF5059516.1 hypothetical protein [Candidatus Neptunochlamydia vexilliferae]
MIWQRYFLREILKVFFLFLFSFFALYVLVDYSMHMQEILKSDTIKWKGLGVYYGMLFSRRCDLLLPLALLISSVKVLTTLNRRNELLALQTAGVALHKLTRPFFFVGLLCVGLSYLNFEFVAPKSFSYISQFEKKYLKKKSKRKEKKEKIHILPLEDGSRLLYQYYDPVKKEFFDLFWIASQDKVYYMKTLSSRGEGTFVDLMERKEKGMEKTASYLSHTFKNLHLNFDLENYFEQGMDNRSITELIQIGTSQAPLFEDKRPIALTHLYFKIVMPWLPVLVLLGAAPFCVPSVRNLPTFLIFALTIFGYITFFTIMDGCMVLGETGALSPFWAIFPLPILFSFIFGGRFLKMCLNL